MVQGQSRHVAAYSKDFLFKAEQLRQPVSALSGGERNRLTLAIALAKASDVLVLDEPTNDLDMQTLELLEDMLVEFDGTLILVSHDRAFLDATVTSCLVPLGNGRWVESAGGWSDAIEQVPEMMGQAIKPAKSRGSSSSKSGPKREAKLSFKDEHRLKEAEKSMAKLGKEIKTLETELTDPNLFSRFPDKFNATTKRLEKAREELEQAELDWMDVEEKRAALEAES